jgi:hypothetical protein
MGRNTAPYKTSDLIALKSTIDQSLRFSTDRALFNATNNIAHGYQFEPDVVPPQD